MIINDIIGDEVGFQQVSEEYQNRVWAQFQNIGYQYIVIKSEQLRFISRSEQMSNVSRSVSITCVGKVSVYLITPFRSSVCSGLTGDSHPVDEDESLLAEAPGMI